MMRSKDRLMWIHEQSAAGDRFDRSRPSGVDLESSANQRILELRLRS